MHPPLDLHLHPKCGEVINALHECHKSTFKRLTGGCNLERRLLDECLGEEFMERRAANAALAAEKRQRFQRLRQIEMEELQEQQRPSA